MTPPEDAARPEDLTRFTASLVDMSQPPVGAKTILLERGEDLSVPARSAFRVRTPSGWRLYYAPEATVIRGPGRVTPPERQGRHSGIFHGRWPEETRRMLICSGAVVTPVLFLLLSPGGDFEMGPGALIAAAALVAFFAADVRIRRTDYEMDLIEGCRPQELPPYLGPIATIVSSDEDVRAAA